jgi:hypothetical protein
MRDNQLKGIQAIHKIFWEKRTKAFYAGLNSVNNLTKESRFIAGLAIYLAEGTKRNNLDITNSNPGIILFMVKWLKEFYQINADSLAIQLHIHSGQNEENMRQYWSKLTGIPLSNFQKSFIKPEGSGYRKTVLYSGTVKLRVKGRGSKYLLFQILGSIAGLLQTTVEIKAKPEDWMSKSRYAI